MFDEFLSKGKVLNQVLSWKEEVLAILLYSSDKMRGLGKNLDRYIETHIHGDIQLEKDIESFYVDSSFHKTGIGEQVETLCEKYGITLCWIPKRQIDVDAIGDIFRGPMIPILAKKIDFLFGKQGFINAELIGQASRDSHLRPDVWRDMGSESDLFQYLKQLWHTVGYFG